MAPANPFGGAVTIPLAKPPAPSPTRPEMSDRSDAVRHRADPRDVESLLGRENFNELGRISTPIGIAARGYAIGTDPVFIDDRLHFFERANGFDLGKSLCDRLNGSLAVTGRPSLIIVACLHRTWWIPVGVFHGFLD